MNGDRTYVFYYGQNAYDYLTQLPTRELMFGGGFAMGGVDEFGNVNDTGYSVRVASYLSGALGVHFGEHNWGEEARPGEGADESRWNEGRVKALWSGILGASVDGLPWIGRVPPKMSGRKQPKSTPLVFSIPNGDVKSQGKDGVSIATDPPSSPDLGHTPSPRVTLAPPGEWIAAGYTGEGMVHAWMSGKALAGMVLGTESKDEQGGQWFPDILRVSERRWKKANMEDLLSQYAAD